ncbi:MAG: tryptophan--tRNA ligase [Deltaproteobacteria bacterium]|nr:tryptophan--tRNA ligase [Deltaproteobacteria bacterium]
MAQERIFSGIQPTGEIHLGNYIGALRNWVTLTDQYECIFSIVDYHAITAEQDRAAFRDNIMLAARTLLACGVDPQKCTLFVQSQVPEHTELAWIFNCLTTIGDLERMTQFKDKSQQHKENINAGLLTYPLLQAADILLYKAQAVPVGEDQVQHIELTRRTARRFNNRFGETFPEPKWLLSSTPRILGLDGKNKMSKSMNNYVGILEHPDAIWEKLRTAVTDENRKRLKDPGEPDICNLYTMHKAFSSAEDCAAIAPQCRKAEIGCVACKKILFDNMMQELEPIQQRAAGLEKNPAEVTDILEQGASRCREITAEVMADVRCKIGVR